MESAVCNVPYGLVIDFTCRSQRTNMVEHFEVLDFSLAKRWTKLGSDYVKAPVLLASSAIQISIPYIMCCGVGYFFWLQNSLWPHFFSPESQVTLSWSLLRPKISNFENHFFEKAPKQNYQNQSRKHLTILTRRPPRRLKSPQQKLGNGSLALPFGQQKKGLSRKPSWTEKLSILRRSPLHTILTFWPPDLQ